jgi:hypothetical protein
MSKEKTHAKPQPAQMRPRAFEEHLPPAGAPRPDFTRAAGLTPEIEAAIDDAMEYHKWTDQQVKQGSEIREAIGIAIKAVVMHAPPCPDRSAAIRKLREARMDANSAITHNGRY